MELVSALGPISSAQEERLNVVCTQQHLRQRTTVGGFVGAPARELNRIDNERLTRGKPVLHIVRDDVEAEADVKGATMTVPPRRPVVNKKLGSRAMPSL